MHDIIFNNHYLDTKIISTVLKSKDYTERYGMGLRNDPATIQKRLSEKISQEFGILNFNSQLLLLRH